MEWNVLNFNKTTLLYLMMTKRKTNPDLPSMEPLIIGFAMCDLLEVLADHLPFILVSSDDVNTMEELAAKAWEAE